MAGFVYHSDDPNEMLKTVEVVHGRGKKRLNKVHKSEHH